MVTINKYFQDSTGIDLSSTAYGQKIAEVGKALTGQSHPGRGSRSVPTALEALYDLVVGVDRVQNLGFDRTSDKPERLGWGQLNHLVDVAQKLQDKYDNSTEQRKVLGAIANRADKYRRLLAGQLVDIPKEQGKHGARHTLIYAGKDAIFEMTNSMHEAEVARFRRKTTMRISAVEAAQTNLAASGSNGKVRKVTLGKGGFGKARIARNICNDQYVAVKKTHPVYRYDKKTGLPGFDPALRSNFSFLPDTKKNQLRSEKVMAAVIVPSNDIYHLAMPTQNTCHKAGYTMKQDQRKALETIYTFSELGISTIEGINKTLNFARAHFENIGAGGKLSGNAVKILAEYGAHNEKPTRMRTKKELDELPFRLYNLPIFTLKDSVHNQKFRNTVAREALQSLATLHAHDFAHNDIKPPNIVLSQSKQKDVTAKLIDIDLIEDSLERLPRGRTPGYAPPEIHKAFQAFGYSGFTGEKGDAYAMGVTLRGIIGHSNENIELAIEQQWYREKLDISKRMNESSPNAEFREEIGVLNSDIANLERFPKAICVRSREEITTVRCLKDVADLLMQVPSRNRLTPRQAMELPFFKNENNFLSKNDFSEKARLIVRFNQFVPDL